MFQCIVISLQNVNTFFAVQNLKMSLKKAKISQHTTESFFLRHPLGYKTQNKGLKEHDGKYIPSYGLK